MEAFTQETIQRLLQQALNSVFRALAKSGVVIDTNGVIDIEIIVSMNDEPMNFSVKLMSTVAADVTCAVDAPDVAMGFHNK